MQDHDYLFVLAALEEIPFTPGKKLLSAVLRGDQEHESVQKNKLYDLTCFGSLAYTEDEVTTLLKQCIKQRWIQEIPLPGKRFIKVLELSSLGKEEVKDPNGIPELPTFKATVITEKDKQHFQAFSSFLEQFNDEQKKAIISPAKKILCIAGAGSGKTTVLTKRVEFLTQYQSIPPEKILAITFTRKARKEMQDRLEKHPYASKIRVETFNSFCEHIIQEHHKDIYAKPTQIISFSEKITLTRRALQAQHLSIEQALNTYFSPNQQKLKQRDELFLSFVNDCFSVMDFFKNEHKPLEDVSQHETLTPKQKDIAKLVHTTCKHLQQLMDEEGRRDYSDQLVDAYAFLEQHPNLISPYTHILVDEYQDVNHIQQKLLALLNPDNLFCVGDPRQSIFGWRGAQMKYILSFPQTYPDAEIITLTKNYRSTPEIVNVMNTVITPMQLPPLEATKEEKGKLGMLGCEKAEEERLCIIDLIKNATFPLPEIFVLARTNRALLELSKKLQEQNIPHSIKGEDIQESFGNTPGVMLATVHAIKGMEASLVIVMHAQTNQFPCRVSDHPVLDTLRLHFYDRDEEELRLFYVALSRAKEQLIITYSSTPTSFLTQEVKTIFKAVNPTSTNSDILLQLKQWRTSMSKKLKMPPYFIFKDTTLEELAAKSPQSLAELQMIIGPIRAQKYGKDVLAILS